MAVDKPGRDTPAELKGDRRDDVRHPVEPVFFTNWNEISHDIARPDGQIKWKWNDPNWDQYVFRRTDSRKPDGGTWYVTGVTTGGAVATW